ncbi:MAG: L-serine ammonia-lyase, iron-sulfur-dependent, subunit alpha [Candidatus Aminicenantales bacterium]
MEFVSILNDVLGPVMHGPSSSHTAGSYHIGRTARYLLGEAPRTVGITFDPQGSYARTFVQQGVDLALASGIMGWSITDRRFRRALEIAERSGTAIGFRIAKIPDADHPNTAGIRMTPARGKALLLTAKSTGGGGFTICGIDGWPVDLRGTSHETVILVSRRSETRIRKRMEAGGRSTADVFRHIRGDETILAFRKDSPLPEDLRKSIASDPEVRWIRSAEPVFRVRKGEPLFLSAAEMVRAAEKHRRSLGEIALEYEARLLGLGEKEVLDEVLRRYRIMKESVARGLATRPLSMQLLRPSAGRVFRSEKAGKTAIGGLHTRAAARAMAVMHVSNSMGIVCAAPTGGAAGALPGVVVTLAEERGAGERKTALMLLAASAVGLILARRATFAAETAGCQVEIGAAGAMAAAAVVEFAGGKPRQAADAAAIAFQNTMGSVCDLVQGICEIPCHTRNAVAASSAFVCADLIMGGYRNPVPLDETIDAVYQSGRMLPPELRCTALGGIALAPSALALPRLKPGRP